MTRKWVLPLLSCAVFSTGCGAVPPGPHDQNSSFMINQTTGPTGTSFNGESIRTRIYDGVRNYGQDNVTIFVTDEDGQTSIYETNPQR